MKYWVLFTCVFITPIYSYAQQYDFKAYGIKEGLNSSDVNAIFQDSKGYYWFGSPTGLQKFDGSTFTNYDKEAGLIDNEITTLAEDLKGNLWIGTAHGISVFNGKSFRNYSTQNGLYDNLIYDIQVDKNNIIIASQKGVNLFSNNKFVPFKKLAQYISTTVYSISNDSLGNYWFATEGNGIIKVGESGVIKFHPEELFGKKSFFSSIKDSKGNLWFGGIDGQGILKFNGNSFSTYELPFVVTKDVIQCITEDSRGNIWFGTSHGALKLDIQTLKFKLFNTLNGLSSNIIQAFFNDYEGNLWFGTKGGGVNLFKNEAFVNYTEKNGLKSNAIYGLFLDQNDKVYVGTQSSGLSVLKGDQFLPIKINTELDNANILCIAKSKDGDLWVGTENNGIFILGIKGEGYFLKKHILEINSSVLAAVMKIGFDSKGKTWITTFGSGLFMIEKSGTITNYSTKNGFISDNLLTHQIDEKDEIWLGSLDEGLIHINNKKVSNYSIKNGLFDNTIWGITFDNKKNVYLGTQEHGIVKFDGSSFKSISIKNGICSNFIESLVWDKNDESLWIGTDKGIDKVKLKSSFDVKSIEHFGDLQGFKGIEVNNNSIVIDNMGNPWFGTINGVSRYSYGLEFKSKKPPKLVLKGIRLKYKNVDWTKFSTSVDTLTNIPQILELSYKNNHLTFDFQATTPNVVKYSYFLEGEENSWSPPSARYEANYPNISPGKSYCFKVKAISSSGIESNFISFNFSIETPWYQSWYFYSFGIVLIIFIIYSLTKYRTISLAKEKKQLEIKIQERTHDLMESNDKLGVALKSITDSIEYALKIQTAILPPNRIIKKYLPDSFILYKPKDIVAGDFYWLESINDLVLFAACDCTGHGVPGAMVSVVCFNALNRSVREFGLTQPAAILDKTAQLVIENFEQSDSDIKDGMDISLCVLDSNTNVLQWAGANNPLWLILNNKLIETKADKQSIGKGDYFHPFVNHEFKLQKGDKIFIFSDGFADQFGGFPERKITKRRFKELIVSIQNLGLKEQGEEIEYYLEQHQGNTSQTDDILVLGVNITTINGN